MSTPPRRTSKTATKRRAAVRRRTREVGRHLFAYFIIGILVIGTISTVIIAQAPTASVPSDATATSIQQSPLDILVTQADQEAAKGNWGNAIKQYDAYLQQNPGSPDVNFKLGKAYVNASPPDYTKASQYLQQAVRLNASATFKQEALSLLSQISGKITPVATGSVPVTGTLILTTTITGTTSPISATGTSTDTGSSTSLPSIPVTGATGTSLSGTHTPATVSTPAMSITATGIVGAPGPQQSATATLPNQ